MPRPTRRDVESCYRFLLWVDERSRDHEYRAELLDEHETGDLKRHMSTALAVVRKDKEPYLHEDILTIQSWAMTDRKELSFREVGRKAGRIAIEVGQVLQYEYGNDTSAAHIHRPRHTVTIPIRSVPPASPSTGQREH